MKVKVTFSWYSLLCCFEIVLLTATNYNTEKMAKIGANQILGKQSKLTSQVYSSHYINNFFSIKADVAFSIIMLSLVL